MEYKPITIETCYKNIERLFKEDHEICNKMKASTHSLKDMLEMDKRRCEIFCLIGIYDRDINRLSKEGK